MYAPFLFIFIKNGDLFFSRIDDFYTKAVETFQNLSTDIKHAEPEELFCDSNLLKKQLLDFSLVEFGSTAVMAKAIETSQIIEFDLAPQPSFNKQFDLLIENLNTNHNKGYTNYISCISEQQAKRFHDIFEDVEQDVHYKTIVLSLYQGFIDHDNKIVCYTDHQIFERYHKFNIKTGFTKRESLTIAELTNLHPGDYVVHIDHGIGKFAGLVKTEVNGKVQEAIRLVYRDSDSLLVSIHSLHRISKYKGKKIHLAYKKNRIQTNQNSFSYIRMHYVAFKIEFIHSSIYCSSFKAGIIIDINGVFFTEPLSC